MDYSIIIIFGLVALAFLYQMYYNYFKRGAKISDRQLIENYIMFRMKLERPHTRFPKMEIKYE